MRLLSDYGAESPTWVGGVMVSPEHLSVSAPLATRLRRWQQHFVDHFDVDHGWDSDTAREWYRVEAEGLVEDLRAELDPDVRLTVDLWPLEPPSEA